MLPQEELPILEALVNIKHRLTALKKDTTKFIRAKDVMSIYSQVAKEVNKLNAVRDRQTQEGMISGSSAITNDEANIPPAAARSQSQSRRGSVAGAAAAKATSALREVYTPNLEETEKDKELKVDSATAGRPGLGLDGRTISIDSTASSSTARQSIDGDDDEEDDNEDDMVSGGGSSRNVSAMSTPFEERGNHLDRFPAPRRFSSARQSPALSPSLDQVQEHEQETSTSTQTDPKTPRASAAPLDTPTMEDPSVDEVSAQMEQQHLSQVDVKPPSETNRVDQVLNDVFGLLSLFFLTIGKTKESPGVYCQIASMRQLLDHMQESGIYTQQDLQPFVQRLHVVKSIIKKDKEEGKQYTGVVKLMWRKWEDCERLLKTLLKSLSVLSVELVPIHQRLVHIRRQLSALAAQLKHEKKELKPLVEELRKIDSSRVDGKFLGPGGTSVPAGQAILVGLLEECFEIIQDIRAREGAENVSPPLKPVWERLTEMRAKLERLQLTHRWTLRETDLYNYAQALREVDGMRVDGSFVDTEGNKAEGQYVLLYLLRRCHGLIYRLIAESEPISEELMPIANKLSTIKKCLNEVMKYGGPFSARDLYPYHLALHQIDSLRQDGKFLSEDGSIPEGQAILVAQLSEAHELLEMLKENTGDASDDEDEDEDLSDDDDQINYSLSKAAPLDATPRTRQAGEEAVEAKSAE